MSAVPVEDLYLVLALFLQSQGLDLERPLLPQLAPLLPSEPHWQSGTRQLTFQQLQVCQILPRNARITLTGFRQAKYANVPADVLLQWLRTDPRFANVHGTALTYWQAHGLDLAPRQEEARPLLSDVSALSLEWAPRVGALPFAAQVPESSFIGMTSH
jgi:hypothetical protein